MTIDRVKPGGPYVFRPGLVQGDTVISVDSIKMNRNSKVAQCLKEMQQETDWTPLTRLFKVIPAGTSPCLRPTLLSITASLMPVRTIDGKVSSILGLIKECVTKRSAEAKCPTVVASVLQNCRKLSLEDVIQAFVTAIETENKGIHEGLSSTDMRVISRSFGAAWVILDHLELDDLVKWHERGPRIKGDEFLWGCLTEFIQKLKGLQAQEVCVGRRCVSTFNPLCS